MEENTCGVCGHEFDHGPKLTEETMEKMNEILSVAKKGDRQIKVLYKQSKLEKEFSGFYRGYDMTQGALSIYSPDHKYVKNISLHYVIDINYLEN